MIEKYAILGNDGGYFYNELDFARDFKDFVSEDKDLVHSVYNKLGALGIEAWFDKAEILPGDNLVRKVFHGFSSSKYVVIFISKAFLSKPWPFGH